MELISRERAERAVPIKDCSGQVTDGAIREDFIRYLLYGAEIQMEKDAKEIIGG